MMSNTNTNQMIHALRRLNNKSDETADQMEDFARRQADGEQPDPEEFVALLKKRSTIHDAMQAQFKLHEKPIKTVLNETK